MNLELHPYPEYTEQANATITSPPAHWRTRRIKYLLREIDDRSPTGTEVLLSMRQTLGLVPHNDVSDKPIAASALIGYKQVVPGDIVVNRMRASTGMVAAASASGLVSPDYAVFRPIDDVDTAYLTLLFKTPAMQTIFRIESKGLGTGSAGFLRLYSDRFAAITIPVPSRFEQDTIVAFVRSWDRRITRLIRAERRQIELLNEQKQAILESLLDHDSRAPRVQLKRVVDLLAGFAFPSAGFSADVDDVRLLRGINVSPGTLRWERTVRWPRRDVGRFSRYRLEVGDLVIGMDRPWISTGVRVAPITEADVPSLLLQRVGRLRAKKGLCQSYLALILGSKDFRDYFEPILTGISVPHISAEQILSFPAVLPSIVEQEAIVRSYAGRSSDLETAILRIDREIDLIREYRTRLIADVVTGKLDVRGVELQLLEDIEPLEDWRDPDVSDEPEFSEAEEEADAIERLR